MKTDTQSTLDSKRDSYYKKQPAWIKHLPAINIVSTAVWSTTAMTYLYMTWKGIAVSHQLQVLISSLAFTSAGLAILYLVSREVARFHIKGKMAYDFLTEEEQRLINAKTAKTGKNKKIKKLWEWLKEFIARNFLSTLLIAASVSFAAAFLTGSQQAANILMVLSLNALTVALGILLGLGFLALIIAITVGIFKMKPFAIKHNDDGEPQKTYQRILPKNPLLRGLTKAAIWLSVIIVSTLTFGIVSSFALGVSTLFGLVPLATIKGLLIGKQGWIIFLFVTYCIGTFSTLSNMANHYSELSKIEVEKLEGTYQKVLEAQEMLNDNPSESQLPVSQKVALNDQLPDFNL